MKTLAPKETNIPLSSTFPQDLEKVFKNYPQSDHIILDLQDTEFVTPYSICGLFIFLIQMKDNNKTTEIIPPADKGCFNYLKTAHFFSMVDQMNLAEQSFHYEYIEEGDHSENLQELNRIKNSKAKIKFLERSWKIMKSLDLDDDVAGRIQHIIGELCDNVFNHSKHIESGYPGAFVCAQRYKDHVRICVGDYGRGIRNSLNKSPDYDISSDGEAILKAIEPGTTGHWKHGDRRGNGLTDIMSIALYSQSEFLIRSKNGRIVMKDGGLESPSAGVLEGTLIEFNLNTRKLDRVPSNLAKVRSEVRHVLQRV